MASWNSFSFFIKTVLTLDSFILKWWATTAIDLNLQYISSHSTFSYNVMTLLLRSPSSITSGTSYGSHRIIQGLWYCTKHNEKYVRTTRYAFLLWYAVYWRETAHEKMISITKWFKQILTTFEFTTIVTGGGYKIITVVQYVPELILCSYNSILHLYICLHFSPLQMIPCMI